jgi:hypothetical protein
MGIYEIIAIVESTIIGGIVLFIVISITCAGVSDYLKNDEKHKFNKKLKLERKIKKIEYKLKQKKDKYNG